MKSKNILTRMILMSVFASLGTGCASIKQQFAGFKNAFVAQETGSTPELEVQTPQSDPSGERQADQTRVPVVAERSPVPVIQPQVAPQNTHKGSTDKTRRPAIKAVQDMMALSTIYSRNNDTDTVVRQKTSTQIPVRPQAVAGEQHQPAPVPSPVSANSGRATAPSPNANQKPPRAEPVVQVAEVRQPAKNARSKPNKPETPSADKADPRQTNSGDRNNEVARINQLTNQQPTAAGIAPEKVLVKPSEPLNTLDQIPATSEVLLADGGWQVEKIHAGRGNECRITTGTFEASSKDYSTQLWLNISKDHAEVVTTTTLDVNNKSGIRFDNGKLIPFSGSPFSNTAVIERNIAKQLLAANEMSIYLSGKEFEGTQSVRIPLNQAKKLYQQLARCK